MTYRRITHVVLPADEVGHWYLDLLQKVSAIILENSNIEHHNALYPAAQLAPRAWQMFNTILTSHHDTPYSSPPTRHSYDPPS